jgi:hypothetical protein
MRAPLLFLALCLVPVVGCDSSESEPDEKFKLKKKFVPPSEREVKVDATPEELAEARKKAGFKSREEQENEAKAMFEKSAREYVKTRAAEYRKFVEDIRAKLDDAEKQADKWAKAKKADAAFEKWKKASDEEDSAFEKRYLKLTGNMAEGGDTTAKLGKAYRAWGELRSNLGPKIAENERFKPKLEEVRSFLEPVDALLDDIEKDDTLKVNKFYEGEDAKKK